MFGIPDEAGARKTHKDTDNFSLTVEVLTIKQPN
jgi:hypothetical protein